MLLPPSNPDTKRPNIMIIFAKLPKINTEILKSIIDKLILFFPFSLNKGFTYKTVKLKTPINLLTTTPKIDVKEAMILNIKINGYNKKVERDILKVVAIENFLKSPFACKIVIKIALKKFKLDIKPSKIEIIMYNKILGGFKYNIIGICII